MVDDWRECLDVIGPAIDADMSRVGYVGVSMGARFGLPLAAAIGSPLRCAVLGKFGLEETTGMYPGADPAMRIRHDAELITIPVLYHVQWDDELFPKDGQLALFDLLKSPGKQLIAFTGAHAETRPEATAEWCRFICRHLADDHAFTRAI